MNNKWIKRRKIKLDETKNHFDEMALKIYLELQVGIHTSDYDKKNGILLVEYELQKINFKTMEKLFSELGIELSNKWKEKLKRGMVKFKEQNELDNLSIKPHSCYEDPKQAHYIWQSQGSKEVDYRDFY
ncbi:MAG: hypothetical protein GTO16_03395 [Candidatus Aminicenantes bacterium]|nr:hypothetical protein [Candidatus Aminicenantes bacterium]